MEQAKESNLDSISKLADPSSHKGKTTIICGNTFVLDERYQIQDYLGLNPIAMSSLQ
jgi:hypothetical protein